MTEIMLPDWMVTFLHACVLIVFMIGLLCFFLRKKYIRQLFGLKLMLQSVSLGLIVTGWQKNEMKLAQSMIISALVLEAVVIGLALTMLIHITKHSKDEVDMLQ